MPRLLTPPGWKAPRPRRKQTPLRRPPLAICSHWIGAGKIDEHHPDRPRNVTHHHMKVNGWSWCSYNFMVGEFDPAIFVAHGLDTEGYSEGRRNRSDPGWWGDAFGADTPAAGESWNNGLCVSILWMIGGGHEPSDGLIRRAAWLHDYIRTELDYDLPAVGHGDLKAKDCPGPAVTALIRAGEMGRTPTRTGAPPAPDPTPALIVTPSAAAAPPVPSDPPAKGEHPALPWLRDTIAGLDAAENHLTIAASVLGSAVETLDKAERAIIDASRRVADAAERARTVMERL